MRYTLKYPKEEFQLTELQKGILESLIRNEELNRYELSKFTGHAYSAIYKATNFLLKNNVIEISRTEENKRNSKIEVDYYKIEPLGVTDFLKASGAELEPYSLQGESFLSLTNNPANNWHRIFSILLKDHSYVFPEEFQLLSRELSIALCPEYFIQYAYTNEDPSKWIVLFGVEKELRKRLIDTGGMRVPSAIQHLFLVFKLLIQAKMSAEIPSAKVEHELTHVRIFLGDIKKSYEKRLCELMSEKDLVIMVNFVRDIALILKRNAVSSIRALDELLTCLEDFQSDEVSNLEDGTTRSTKRISERNVG